MLVAVGPHRAVRGIHAPGWVNSRTGKRVTSDWRQPPGSEANTFRARPQFVVTPLVEALRATYSTDAHLQTCVMHSPDGVPLERQPRPCKDALPWLMYEGFAIYHDVIMVDVDNPKHAKWSAALRRDFEAMLSDRPDSIVDAGVYVTAHGYRLVQPLDEPVSASEVERYLAAWAEQLRDDGIEPDRACVDWTRHFRLPNVRRAKRDYQSPLIDLEQMRPRAITPKGSPGGPRAGRRAVAAPSPSRSKSRISLLRRWRRR